jgi:hypothetical protein
LADGDEGADVTDVVFGEGSSGLGFFRQADVVITRVARSNRAARVEATFVMCSSYDEATFDIPRPNHSPSAPSDRECGPRWLSNRTLRSSRGEIDVMRSGFAPPAPTADGRLSVRASFE